MPIASHHFGTPQASLPLPMQDKRMVEWNALKKHLPETRLFIQSAGHERDAMLKIIEYCYDGRPALRFPEALNAVGDAIGYVARHPHDTEALLNIDPADLGKDTAPISFTIAYTALSMVLEKAQTKPPTPSHP